jgi:hypothetical protein
MLKTAFTAAAADEAQYANACAGTETPCAHASECVQQWQAPRVTRMHCKIAVYVQCASGKLHLSWPVAGAVTFSLALSRQHAQCATGVGATVACFRMHASNATREGAAVAGFTW